MRDIEKLNKTCFLYWLYAQVNTEENEKAEKFAKDARNNNNGRNKMLLYLTQTHSRLQIKRKTVPNKSQICKNNADRLITKTIVRLKMEYHRGMKIDREDKKHYGKC